MSREKIIINLGHEVHPGNVPESSPISEYDRERVRADLQELSPNEYLVVPDPESPGLSIRVRLRSSGVVFRERVTATERGLGKRPREFTMDFMVDWYLKHRAFVRREVSHDGSQLRFEIKRPKGEVGIAHKHEAAKANNSEQQRQQLRELLVGEAVVVYEPTQKRLVRFVKVMSQPSQFSPADAEKSSDKRARMNLYLSNEEELLALAQANPTLVEFLPQPEVRQKEAKRQLLVKQFDVSSSEDAVIIGNNVYDLRFNGLYGVRTSFPQSRKEGTRMLTKGTITHAEMRSLIERAWNVDEISLIEKKHEKVGTFSESDQELQAVHERFAQLVPELYPAAVQRKKLGVVLHKFLGSSEENNYDKVINHLRENSHIEQGQIGVCYGLGAAHGIKSTSPELYFDMIARTIRKEGDTWQVRFLGVAGLPAQERQLFEMAYPGGWIPVTDREIREWRQGITVEGQVKSASKADLADIILERAYLSYQSYFTHGAPGQTFIASAKGRIAGEGGFGHRALFDFLGPLVEKWKIADYESGEGYSTLVDNGHAEEAVDFFEGDYATHSSEYFVTANTPAYKDGIAKNEKYVSFKDPDTGEVRKLHKKHAYAVIGYRITKNGEKQVRLANPHNTKTKVFWMSLSDFTAIYSQVSYAKLEADYRRNDPAAKKIIEQAYTTGR